AVVHGCSIGDDCLIGMNSTINSGAVIGPGSVVASGAVIRENAEFSAGGLIAGVPAKIIRNVDETLRRRIDLSWPIYRELAKASLPPRPAIKGDPSKQVAVWPSKIGNSSFTLSYEIKEKRSGRILARAKSVLVSYDYEKKKSKPISDDFRSLLQSGLEA